jgi:hypothetical protein
MFLLGYPVEVVVTATLALYVIYIGVEMLYMGVAFWVAEGEAKARLRRLWWMPLFMPAYRWLVFWFRFSGFLSVLKDPKQWRTRDPITESFYGARHLATMMMTFLTQSFLPRLAALIGGVVRLR